MKKGEVKMMLSDLFEQERITSKLYDQLHVKDDEIATLKREILTKNGRISSLENKENDLRQQIRNIESLKSGDDVYDWLKVHDPEFMTSPMGSSDFWRAFEEFKAALIEKHKNDDLPF